MGKRFFAVVACTAVLVQPIFAAAEPGVSAKEIVIGSCSVQSGPAQALGVNQIAGAKAYFDQINAQGGVNGRKLNLVVEDDRYEPDSAVVCFKKLEDMPVFAAAFFVGTPTAAKYAPMAETNKLPVVGLFTGAGILRNPVKRYIFNVRGSYGDETKAQIDHFWDLGMKKIGVIYQADAFGVAVLDGVTKALAAHGAQPVALGSFQRNTTDVSGAISPVRGANPDAVVIVGPYASVAAVLKQSHAAGWKPLFSTVSFVGTEELVGAAGPDAEGMVITQVVPPPSRKDLPTVANYIKASNKAHVKPNFGGLEGYIDAIVLVDGLKKAGKDLTREGLVDALEGMKDVNVGLGDLKVSYSSENHQAFNDVVPTVIQAGEARVISDWSELKH